MKEAVIFNGFSALDFLEIRQTVMRIPEVAIRLREVQKLWDKYGPGPLDVLNHLTSEDPKFYSSLSLKQFLVSVVQIGLFDRFLKRNKMPSYLVGIVSNDSALTVCAKEKELEDLTLEFIARLSHQSSVAVRESYQDVSEQMPNLAGAALDQFGVIDVLEGPAFMRRQNKLLSPAAIVQELVDVEKVKRFVHIGPGRFFFSDLHKNYALSEVEFIESIEIDPMLNWFWPAVRESSQAVNGSFMV